MGKVECNVRIKEGKKVDGVKMGIEVSKGKGWEGT